MSEKSTAADDSTLSEIHQQHTHTQSENLQAVKCTVSMAKVTHLIHHRQILRAGLLNLPIECALQQVNKLLMHCGCSSSVGIEL